MVMNMKNPISSPARKEGIALIVTMGFLAIIAILAVSFAITMRVERLVGRSYADNVRARQLVHVGLARALETIHTNAFTNNLYYPAWVDNSLRSTGAGGTVTNTVLSGSVMNYIPGSVRAGAIAQAASMQWVPITVNYGSGNRLVGRYAFLAVNCSGLLDPNGDYVSAVTLPLPDRQQGLSPYELQLSNVFLSELSASGVNIYPARRGAPRFNNKGYGRAESVADLWIAGRWYYSGTAPFQGNGPVVNFFPFSYFPRGFLTSNGTLVTNLVNIGGAAPPVADITAAFTAMGFGAYAPIVANNLIDFLDSDYTPAGGAEALNNISAEPVPMINEIVLANVVTYDGTNWYNDIRMWVELFYPFGSPANSPACTLDVALNISDGDFTAGEKTWTAAIPSLTGPNGFHVADSGATTFRWVSAAPAPIMPTQLSIVRLRVLLGGRPVDQVQPVDIRWNDHFHNVSAGAANPKGTTWACDDPRINWDLTDPVQWTPVSQAQTPPTHTLGTMNVGRVTFGAPGKDGHHVMFARQGPAQTPGEVAFLLPGKTPWQTIALWGAGAPPVVDYFTTTTDTFRRGIVNVNTENRNVLAQVFYDTPLERWPGEAGAPKVTQAQATAIANAIYTAGSVPNQYKSVSDIARSNADAALGAMDPLQKKALMRNSSMLLGARQNIYSIIVIAQAVVDANNNSAVENDEVIGEQRALAVVWRDPYRVNNTYETFVRFFRWLDD